MALLTGEQQTLIVIRLACYATSTEIQQEFKEAYDFKPSYSQISYYDPFTAQGSEKLDKDLRALFWKTREAHDKTLARIPIANLYYRLLLLNRIASDPVLGKTKLGLKALEQAAKEVGGMYDRQEDAGDVEIEIEALLAQLGKAKKQRAAAAGAPSA